MSPAVIIRNDENKEAAIRRIRAIRPDQDKPMGVFIGPFKQIRSLQQNALYFQLLSRICDATGHHKDTLHHYFKRRAFGIRVEQVGEEIIEVIPSSARVAKGDFSQLIEHVQQFIAENGFEDQV